MIGMTECTSHIHESKIMNNPGAIIEWATCKRNKLTLQRLWGSRRRGQWGMQWRSRRRSKRLWCRVLEIRMIGQRDREDGRRGGQ